MAIDLVVSCEIETPLGPLQLEDPEGGYELHKESFSTRAVSKRNIEVTGDWTEGSDIDRSLRNNVTETLSVWVGGATQWEFQSRVNALTAALDQLAYSVTRVIGDAQEVWDCRPAEYTIETQQEYYVATTGLVKAQVPHKPAVVLTQVAP